MSGSPGRIVPEINLDEFERRLRSAGAAQDGAEDPLAELTRLVDMISRDDSKASAAAQAPRAPAPKGQRFPAGAGAPVAHVGSGRIQSLQRLRRAGWPDGPAQSRRGVGAVRRRRGARSFPGGARRAVGGGDGGASGNTPLALVAIQDCCSCGARLGPLGRRCGVEARRGGFAQEPAVHRGRRRAKQDPAAERRHRAVGRRYCGAADEGFDDVGASQGRLHGRAAGRPARADAESGTDPCRFGCGGCVFASGAGRQYADRRARRFRPRPSRRFSPRPSRSRPFPCGRTER